VSRAIIDTVDRAILAALQEDGFVGRSDLARRLGLSVRSVSTRIRRLRADGVLLGLHASLSPGAVGIGVQAMGMVTLRRHDDQAMDAFERVVLAAPQICSCCRVTGPYDYVVRLAVEDLTGLRSVLMHELADPELIARVETLTILDEVKPHSGWPLRGQDDD
jgi:Lrp/AsnC family transcriptional regulator, leucine-responsive regulatory protein